MAMMTYSKFVESNPDPIIKQSDETVQNAVFDWFKYRYIGFENTSKFLDILQRNVKINYPIYRQKLRIEPGVSQYDWLVSSYRELQHKSNGTSNGTATHKGTQTTTGTGDSTDIRTGSQTNDHTGNDTAVKSGNETTKNTGTDTGVKSGNETTKNTGTDTGIKSGNETIAKDGTDTRVKTGGHTETDVAGLHTVTTSPHVSRVTTHNNDTSNFAGNQSIQSNLPMSKSYDKFITPDDDTGTAVSGSQQYQHAYQHMPALDWSTASAQAQDGHREYGNDTGTTTESYKYGDGVEGDIQTTQGSDSSPDTRSIVYNDETDATNYGSKDTHSYNDVKDTQTHDALATHTYNDVTDTQTHDTLATHTYNDVKDTADHTATDTLTYNSVTDTHTNNSNGTVTSDGTDTTEGTDSRTDREQMTGRTEDPATLLTRATAFIERSSAFMWLKEQLDSCFFPGYYTDDDETEGSCNI